MPANHLIRKNGQVVYSDSDFDKNIIMAHLKNRINEANQLNSEPIGKRNLILR